MLTLWTGGPPRRRGPTRRDFLRIGGLGMCGLTLPALLRHEAAAAPAAPGRRPKSVIYIVLGGGLSHLDSYDPKPEAPAEIRGPFSPIATRLPGVQFCEWMPLQAQMLDRLVLLRGVRSVENDHYLSEVYTGLPRGAGRRPAFGSVVSKLVPSTSPLPPYVSLEPLATDPFEYEKPHYLGAGHAPYRPFGSALDDLAPSAPLERLHDRQRLLTALDAVRRRIDRQLDAGLDVFQARALEMIASPAVRQAFDMRQEPPESLAAYGRGKYPHQTVKDILYDWDPKPFVLARRLVEAGVRVVTLRVAQWDHHSSAGGDIFFALRCLLPLLDQSVAALARDLRDRGLENDVLVVVLGEFGRTPRIVQPGPGREHWADAGSAVLFGGGVRPGQVIGQTDAHAERAKAEETDFQRIVASIYRLLGVDPAIKLPDFNGRPQYLLERHEPIPGLFA